MGRAGQALLLAALALLPAMLGAQQPMKTVAERLGYPPDSKLLIVHADDLAVAHSVDRASFAALDGKAVSSASVMVPCPWLTEVAAYARAHPQADLGLHLTLTSEWRTYRWGPVSSRESVPTLLDPDGYFWAEVRGVARAKPEEVEREVRAQIERALRAGIHPTHLDSHMGALFQSPALFAVYLKVARDYRLPFLAARLPNAPPELLALLTEKDIVLDGIVMMNAQVPPERWKESYLEALQSLKPGLNELIVHLGYDDAELEAISVDHPDFGAAWRQRDFEVVTSPEFRKALKDNHIIVVGWKDVKKLL